jgi:AcrR family transcriptional regulator
MNESSEAARPSQQAAILEAAVKVFFQFGYRKTMDDVATAAKVSRQVVMVPEFASSGRPHGAA